MSKKTKKEVMVLSRCVDMACRGFIYEPLKVYIARLRATIIDGNGVCNDYTAVQCRDCRDKRLLEAGIKSTFQEEFGG